MPDATIVQLVTLPNGKRVRCYWGAGVWLGTVYARATDAAFPDDDYAPEHLDRSTVVGEKHNPNHQPAGGPDGGQFAPSDGGDGGSGDADAVAGAIERLPAHGLAELVNDPSWRKSPLQIGGTPLPGRNAGSWTDARGEIEAILPAFDSLVRNAETRDMAFSKIKTYQTWVKTDRLAYVNDRWAEMSDKPLGVVVHHGGSNWLVDGNHRATVAKLRGQDTISVFYADLDAAPSPARGGRLPHGYQPSPRIRVPER